MRLEQEALTEEARRRRLQDEARVTEPLRRAREDMRRNNHVYENIVRLLREGRT